MTIFAVFCAVFAGVRKYWRARHDQFIPDTAERRQMWTKGDDVNMRLD